MFHHSKKSEDSKIDDKELLNLFSFLEKSANDWDSKRDIPLKKVDDAIKKMINKYNENKIPIDKITNFRKTIVRLKLASALIAFKNKKSKEEVQAHFDDALRFFPEDVTLIAEVEFLKSVNKDTNEILGIAKIDNSKNKINIGDILSFKKIGAKVEMALANRAYKYQQDKKTFEFHFREAFKYLPDDMELAKEMAVIRREHYLKTYEQPLQNPDSSKNKDEKKASVDDSKKYHSYANLVFQGGGAAGIAYVGALQELSKCVDLNIIRRIGGASAGAIVALLLCLDYKVEDIEDILKNELVLTELLDGEYLRDFLILNQNKDKISSKFERLAAIAERPSLRGTMEARNITKELKEVKHGVTLLSEQDFGLFPGDYFRFLMERFVQQKTGIPYATFREIDNFKNSDISKNKNMKEMYIIGANISTQTSEIFSLEHNENVIISDALRISMSIPLVYKPHQIYYKQDGKRVLDSKDHLYVDGGVLDNQPIWLFDKIKYFLDANVKDQEISAVNPYTLCFRLVNDNFKAAFDGKNASMPMVNKKPVTLPEYLLQLISTIYNKQESDSYKQGSYEKSRTIYIDRLGVTAVDMDIDESKQDQLKNSGRHAIGEYFKRRLRIHEQICLAISGNDTNTIMSCLNENIDLNYINKESNSYLDLALETGNKQLIFQLILRGANNCKNRTGIINILEEAFKSGFLDNDFIQKQLAFHKNILAHQESLRIASTGHGVFNSSDSKNQEPSELSLSSLQYRSK